MNRYHKRLIEVDLPISQVSQHARQDKDSRMGHIPRLHIYPAARPVAACRAVALAAMLPDPCDTSASSGFDGDLFRQSAKEEMVRWAEACFSKASAGSYPVLKQIKTNPHWLDDVLNLRSALLQFVADFAAWDASTDRDFQDLAKRLILAAHLSGGGMPGTKPTAFDAFAGGGAIPLETSRLGAHTVAFDLNPVAVLLNKIILEHVPVHGQSLRIEMERWLPWAKARATKQLGVFYPAPKDGAKIVAYLWARTVVSTAPSRYSHPIEIPLIKTMVLARKRKRLVALRWIRDSHGQILLRQSRSAGVDGRPTIVLRPEMEIYSPKSLEEVEPGTVQGRSVTCPVTGHTMRMAEVQRQLSKRNGGSADARLYCVVFDPPDGSARSFRVPTEPEIGAAANAAVELEKRFGNRSIRDSKLIPDEPTPLGGGKGAGRAFSQRSYNMVQFRDLFHPRQLLSLLTYADLIREYVDDLRNSKGNDFADAVNACLALLLDRMADLNASLCVWQLNTPNTAHVFGRWVLQMTFDFGEVNPLVGAGGSPESAAARAIAAIDNLVSGNIVGGTAHQASADNLPLPDDSADLLFTDPPYYDAVPYSDLLDFFHVWLKRSLSGGLAVPFADAVGPKEDECIVDEVKGKTPEYFEEMMTKCLREARRIVKPSGVGIVVFAHKSTKGWEHMLQAIVDAGWTITASWPIDTEMGSRLRAKESATLSSSIHLVCRPRENPDSTLRTDDIGDWRDVLGELPQRIHDWMPRLAQEGVVGADAIFACIGPALEIFSRYSRVERASGEAVTLKEYLEQVWAAVAKEALTMIFTGADATGFEEDARITAMWLWTLRTSLLNGDTTEPEEVEDESEEEEKPKQPGGYSMEYDAARKIAQGLGVHMESMPHLVQIKGDTATLQSVAARTRYLFGKEAPQAASPRRKKERQLTLSLFDELEEIEEASGVPSGDLAGRPNATVLDQLHQAMILFGAGRSEALRRFLVTEGVGRNALFWRLAQSLSALYPSTSEEKRWLDGVLARKKGLGL